MGKEDIDEIVAQHDFKPTEQLVEEFGVSKKKIYHIWEDHGLPNRPGRKYYFDENYFHKIDSPDKAYFLGLLASDGSITVPTHGQPCVNLALLSSDVYILEYFNKCLNTEKPIKNNGGIKYKRVSYPSNVMVEDLAKYNIVKKKTYDYEMIDLGEDYMSHFFRGYFDGDGSIFEVKTRDTLSRFLMSICGFEHNMIKMLEYLNTHNVNVRYTRDYREYEYPFGSIHARSAETVYRLIVYLYRDCGDCCLPRKRIIANRFLSEMKEKYEKGNLRSLKFLDH